MRFSQEKNEKISEKNNFANCFSPRNEESETTTACMLVER